ncbi:MAG TPA: polyphosphate kinase 1 [Thermoanaerobaculia bacterium]|nr:polyphosphate kinase 1 [Thermoanaerobaculia bacterium]
MPQSKPLPLLNRELSRLDYNRRVLAKAEDAEVPLLERLRFLAFCSRNLDEFFMVRIGATRDLIDAGIAERSPDGLLPAEQMAAMRMRTRELLADLYRCFNERLLPELKANGVVIEDFRNLGSDEQAKLSEYFRDAVAPVLTPLAVDPGHPFPFVANLSLTIAVTVESQRGGEHLVLIKLPPLLPRFIAVAPGGDVARFVPIGSLVMAHLDHFFPSLDLRGAVLFRVIRNSELSIDRDEVEDLRDSVEAELRRRERKQVVCLEIDGRATDELVRALTAGTRAREEDVYPVPGFMSIRDMVDICDSVDAPALFYPPFNPRLPLRLATTADIFSIVRERDVLLHRPYDSFTAVIELLHAAATDPAVVAIKQTLYQTDEDSPVIDKLVLAALSGKQVTVVIELQARFEEKRNIAMAARLHDAGAQVVYGLVGIQAHAKMCIVVRAEEGGLRHYVHMSTGNYNVDTARVYTDFDLLTAHEEFGQESSQLMNVLTGFSASSLAQVLERPGARPQWTLFAIAPFDYHRLLVAKIDRETKHAKDKKPARIAAKLNSLVDPVVIDALYRAADAGVKIDLIVRAICSLVPRENIRVISIVDRFLEHSRVVRFENAGSAEIYLSSGDWMPRNFVRRVEVMYPLLDPTMRERAASILETSLGDGGSSWELQPDGTWTPRRGGVSSQQRFIEITRAEAVALGPYDAAIEQAPKIRRKARRKR